MLQVPQPNTTRYGKNSVKYLAAITWNKISDTLRSLSTLSASKIACSRLSDCGEDAKVKACEKLAGREKKEKGNHPFSPQFPPLLFSCSRFLNSASPIISVGAWNRLLLKKQSAS